MIISGFAFAGRILRRDRPMDYPADEKRLIKTSQTTGQIPEMIRCTRNTAVIQTAHAPARLGRKENRFIIR
jgi:hypothetical protein